MNGRLERLATRIRDGARLAAWRSMTGGSSAFTVKLRLRHANGNSEFVVLRLYGERDLRQNPRVAECEFRLLGVASRLGLPVPSPILLGEPDEDWPTPFTVIEHVDGEPDFTRMYLDAARVDDASLLYWDLFAALAFASNFEGIAKGWTSAPMPGRAVDVSELWERLRQFADSALSRL